MLVLGCGKQSSIKPNIEAIEKPELEYGWRVNNMVFENGRPERKAQCMTDEDAKMLMIYHKLLEFNIDLQRGVK